MKSSSAGGTPSNLPTTSTELDKRTVPFTEVVALLGEQKALQLCRMYGGRRIPRPIDILRERQDEAIWVDWCQGASLGEISMKYGISANAVKNKIIVRCHRLEAEKMNVRGIG